MCCSFKLNGNGVPFQDLFEVVWHGPRPRRQRHHLLRRPLAEQSEPVPVRPARHHGLALPGGGEGEVAHDAVLEGGGSSLAAVGGANGRALEVVVLEKKWRWELKITDQKRGISSYLFRLLNLPLCSLEHDEVQRIPRQLALDDGEGMTHGHAVEELRVLGRKPVICIHVLNEAGELMVLPWQAVRDLAPALRTLEPLPRRRSVSGRT